MTLPVALRLIPLTQRSSPDSMIEPFFRRSTLTSNEVPTSSLFLRLTQAWTGLSAPIWASSMVNVFGASGAGLKTASPACDAVIVHEPAWTMWTVAGATSELIVQSPEAASATGRPELAVGAIVKSASRYALVPIGSKVIVWSALVQGPASS